MKKMDNILRQVSNWYFSKKVLPYWVVILADASAIFACGIFTYWISSNSQITYDHHQAVFISALVYAAFSLISARLFRTYSGVLRYSSFVDLLKLTFANLVSMGLALIVYFVGNWQGIEMISAITPLKTIVTFLLATMLMWSGRVIVKVLFVTVS